MCQDHRHISWEFYIASKCRNDDEDIRDILTPSELIKHENFVVYIVDKILKTLTQDRLLILKSLMERLSCEGYYPHKEYFERLLLSPIRI